MKTVLFVCVRNASRSQMAEAFFNKMAKGKARAISAGAMPADAVNPTVVQAMREIGIDISAQKPKDLTPEMVSSADLAVTMGCSVEGICVPVPGAIEWNIEDPRGKPIEKVRQIRDEIEAKVKEMMKREGLL